MLLWRKSARSTNPYRERLISFQLRQIQSHVISFFLRAVRLALAGTQRGRISGHSLLLLHPIRPICCFSLLKPPLSAVIPHP
ncbi:hypothetical protein ACN38_g2749 [Penicillium nordicum]|uniref:Uncharacterized protein n=1 Tax=Penicillium nordicum TaxID=229535 RepID=A0A0M8P6B3_9EURO|nr:hypothetical protein ACN38_g2749 [Penicillium nordicum]